MISNSPEEDTKLVDMLASLQGLPDHYAVPRKDELEEESEEGEGEAPAEANAAAGPFA